jgi:protein TonB
VATIDRHFREGRTTVAVPTLPQFVIDRPLLTAFAVSFGVHSLALAVRFVDPEFFRTAAADPPLEIVLVNARSETRPTKAQVLAQVNLDGGGTHDQGRKTSPLPNQYQNRDGDALDMARQKVEQLEAERNQLLSQLIEGPLANPDMAKEQAATEKQSGAAEETANLFTRTVAEIAQRVTDYQKRPRKHNFMPSTSEYRFARYVEDWRARVEKVGNDHYPDEARGKIYGTLRMTVAIRKDGTVTEATIEESSGSPVLDRAARRIVKLASPYPPFPPEIAVDTDILEITRTWTFTNDTFATGNAPVKKK